MHLLHPGSEPGLGYNLVFREGLEFWVAPTIKMIVCACKKGNPVLNVPGSFLNGMDFLTLLDKHNQRDANCSLSSIPIRNS